ncbi:hypothetical protein M2271_002849 [Streptomyces sp. LBL]|uniref:hypothetical protein n=1 Tax=Streptomyces sp. LBL TaxID=2940562 RepID=UPI00247304FB|nr:hypothetical protein [Streptomyces sp. LBL]MDH6625045.1 hypothetical protein [Streptomyces sp. LBL]
MTAPHSRTTRSGAALRVLRAAVFAAVCVVLAALGHALTSCAAVPLWTLGAGFLGAVLVAAPLAGRERSLPGITALLALGQTGLHVLFGLGQHGMAADTATAAAGSASLGSLPSMASMTSLSDASLVEQAARLVCGTTAAAISPVQAQKILVDARVHPVTTGGTGTGVTPHPADALSTAAGSSMSLLPSLPMLLGHVLAALAAGWLLRCGDLALLRLAELSAVSAHSVAEGALVRSLRGALALVRALRAGLPGTPEAGPRRPRTALLTPPPPRTTALQHTVTRRGPPAVAALVLTA